QEFIVPAILHQEFSTIANLVAAYSKVRRHNFAKSGIETAFWHLLSQAEGKPLAQLLGGTRTAIESGVSIGIEPDTKYLLKRIEGFLAQSYRRIKLKIGPGQDVEVLRQVRQAFPTIPLMADANSAYTLADLEHLKQLEAFNLLMIEQPLSHDDIIDHATLQRALSTPICLDESIHSAEDARKALDLGSCRIINIKPGRVGGLLEACKIHDLCQARGIPVWCGGMHEYGIGRAHNIALSALPNFSIPGDISASDKYYAEDLIDPPVTVEHGKIDVPQALGLGYTPNEERIARFTVEKLTFT
ncbi:MAG TPA: o-succinylbenzoate synthase, partial [Gammaproteobacteria bacterium]|nr:o-succinylbenzoate synthase [Gammaproteobacteria bacterium]